MIAELERSSSQPEFNDGWRGLIDFLSDWYWEQDENLRYTLMTGRRMRAKNVDTSPIIGKLRWEQERIWDLKNPSWEEHKAALAAREPFTNFTYKITARNGELRYVSVSGQPFYSKDGVFKGYRGIGKDVTGEVRAKSRRTIERSVIQALATAGSISECAPHIIQSICETLGWTCGAYWEFREKGKFLECIQSWSDDSPGAREFIETKRICARLSSDATSIACAAWEKGETVWVSDLAAADNGDAPCFLASGNLHSAFALPIKIGDQVISVLEFYSEHIHQPDTELLDCSAFIANQISQFTQLMRSREQLCQSEERFRSLIELSSDWIWEQDEQFRFTFFEGNYTKKASNAAKPTSQLGKCRWDLPALNLTEEDWKKHKEQLERHETFRDLFIRRTDLNGRERWLSISGMPVFLSSGEFKGYRGIAKDISELKHNEKHIQYLATHDTLTDLPNRVMFNELLSRTIQTNKRYERKCAVMFIDLDRFKIINDSLGHEAGDMLLKKASARLKRCVRATDVVARLGGDEFVILFPEVENEKTVETVAKKILSNLFKPVTLLGQECRVSGSIGISMYPLHAQDDTSLMKCADAAMYQAKEAGKNQFRFYSEVAQSKSLERMMLETSLRHAIERKQLFLHYQAKLDLRTRRVAGVEALLRWKHPELGAVSPSQFIPLAEETGLIVPIGRWVLETACTQAVAWQKRGLPKMGMAINLSARQFNDDSLIADIKAILRKTGLAPELLELELTESMVVQHTGRANNVLQDLKKLGVKIAIDDFGTGYSSMAQLRNFPIDTLKVDRSFIQEIPMNRDDEFMTKAIINMGKSLGLTVIAEGVETKEQETFLSANACDETQGFYFSRPMPADGIEGLLNGERQES